MNQPQASIKEYPALWMGWAMWCLAALLYFYTFYQRLAPGVMTRELMTDFGISAGSLGNLAAFYFYAYAAMQAPTGILADKWGPRKLLCTGALVSALGTLIFAVSPNMAIAGIGRLLIGGSVAVTFVCMLKLAANWLPPRLFALASGMIIVVGSVGAAAAGTPLSLLVQAYGWRPVMLCSAGYALVIAAIIWVFMRDDPSQRGYKSYAAHGRPKDKPAMGTWAGLKHIFEYRNTWLLFIAPSGITGATLTFSGLWGIPYTLARYDVDPSTAALAGTLHILGWALGSPIMAWLTDYMGSRKKLYMAGVIISSVAWAGVFYLELPFWLYMTLVVIAGVFSGCMLISFAYVKESVPLELAGTVSGVINMGIMLGPIVMQPLTGWVLDLYWQGQLANGARVYSVEAYKIGFTPMLAWSVAACFLIGLTKDTRCKQQA
jgi:predicted MFS family arabinose efflux permease